MYLGYNTNGLAHHDLAGAIELLASIGYRGIAITLDHAALNPYSSGLEMGVNRVASALAKHRFRCVIETGARYLLDPRTKHEPTLITGDPAGRQRRVDFLCRALDIASRLGADCVSLWSGILRDGAGDREVFDRLAEGLVPLLKLAEEREVPLAFEPEPGMFIDTLSRFDDLVAELEARRIDATWLGLTIDIGHLHCQGEVPLAAKIEAYRGWLLNVHIEDMRAGIHEHLMFGEGEIDFPPVIAALAGIGYAGMVGVELSRHSPEGPEVARRSYEFLAPIISSAIAGR